MVRRDDNLGETGFKNLALVFYEFDKQLGIIDFPKLKKDTRLVPKATRWTEKMMRAADERAEDKTIGHGKGMDETGRKRIESDENDESDEEDDDDEDNNNETTDITKTTTTTKKNGDDTIPDRVYVDAIDGRKLALADDE